MSSSIIFLVYRRWSAGPCCMSTSRKGILHFYPGSAPLDEQDLAVASRAFPPPAAA